MKQISVLIKPASSLCNMGCNYCFYHDIADQRTEVTPTIMNNSVRDALIAKILLEATGKGPYPEGGVTFAFQGGEPTLAGLSFFEGFVAKVEELNKKGIPVSYALQTNGIVINRDWAEFFALHKVLVGLSLDGTEDIHNSLRRDRAGKPTYHQVMQAAKLFNEYHVSYNILTVVTTQLAYHIEDVFTHYAQQGFRFLQFIPCLDPLYEDSGDYSLPPRVYGEFLIQLFSLWYKKMRRGDGVSIRYFDNLLGICLGYPPESCDMVGHCSIQRVVEADGTVFPCDFYTRDQDALGNITTKSIAALEQSPLAKSFIESSCKLPEICRCCQWKNLCRNGCRRHRDPKTGVNRYCSAYQSFFTTHGDNLMRLARHMHHRMLNSR